MSAENGLANIQIDVKRKKKRGGGGKGLIILVISPPLEGTPYKCVGKTRNAARDIERGGKRIDLNNV